MQAMHDRWAAQLELQSQPEKRDTRKKFRNKDKRDKPGVPLAPIADTAYPPTLLPRVNTTLPIQPVDALLQQANQSVQALEKLPNHHQLDEHLPLDNAMDLDSALRMANSFFQGGLSTSVRQLSTKSTCGINDAENSPNFSTFHH